MLLPETSYFSPTYSSPPDGYRVCVCVRLSLCLFASFSVSEGHVYLYLYLFVFPLCYSLPFYLACCLMPLFFSLFFFTSSVVGLVLLRRTVSRIFLSFFLLSSLSIFFFSIFFILGVCVLPTFLPSIRPFFFFLSFRR